MMLSADSPAESLVPLIPSSGSSLLLALIHFGIRPPLTTRSGDAARCWAPILYGVGRFRRRVTRRGCWKVT